MSSLHADEWLPIIRDKPPEAKRWTLRANQDAGHSTIRTVQDAKPSVPEAGGTAEFDLEEFAREELAAAQVAKGDDNEVANRETIPMSDAGYGQSTSGGTDSDHAAAARISDASALRPVRQIGSGGMGSVHLMTQERLDRPVAVKILHDRHRDKDGHQQFQAEIRTTSMLEHPTVVPVHDAGDDYLVMKCVDGQTFSELLSQQPPIHLVELVEVLIRVGDCLAYAHEHWIIHRDLKPENIMVGDFGETYLMDWGLAVGCDPRSGDHVQQIADKECSVCAGTPCYMPPEVAAGMRHEIGPASDVFGLCAVLYETLTGVPPFDGDTVRKTIDHAASNG